MRGMILAAGRGDRMRELTAHQPKPLLKMNDHYLIEYAIASLKRADIREIVINISYLGEQIKSALGDGKRYGVDIHYSEEKERLETGGGIFQALPWLGNAPFLAVSCDIIMDYPLQNLLLPQDKLAHLLLVDNPHYHPNGDFGLRDGIIDKNARPTYTFANAGVYHPDLFLGCSPGHFRLTQVLNPAIAKNQITGEVYRGVWHNIGTPEDLNSANSPI